MATIINETARFELQRLERKVADGCLAFVEAGLALNEIRRKDLFLIGYPTWAYYLRNRWGMSDEQGRRLITAAQIVRKDLPPIGGVERLVLNESQIRPLAKLRKSSDRRLAFEKAAQSAGNCPPTATQVTDAVRRLIHDQVLAAHRSEKSISSSGRTVELGSSVQIFCGNSLDPNLVKSESVHLIVGSPPYNLGISHPSHSDDLPVSEYLAQCDKWLSNCYGWSVEGGRLAINVPVDVAKPAVMPLGSEFTRLALENGWTYIGTIIWAEGSHGHWPLPDDPIASPVITCPCEFLLIFAKGSPDRVNPGVEPDVCPGDYRRWMQGWWQIAGAHATKVGHPCPFPAEIPRRLIQMLSYKGETVLDPWMGSGTTVVEGVKLGRKVIGIEIEESYCEAARRSVNEAQAALSTSEPSEELSTLAAA
jgi:site-specific DNA-methyltransferase (adenine-specific)